MKTKLKEKLIDASTDQLLDIIDALCLRDKTLEGEIEFILSPKKIKQPQSYYNRYVKRVIDTNSWSKFPNKGITGLNTCLNRVKIFEKVGNLPEAIKLSKAMFIIINKCKNKYNNQNTDELLSISKEILEY